MQERATVVIVGAGVVGCSTAYHLANLGLDDVLVLDQGPLFQTGGSTSHAPGLIFETNASRTMTRFAQYTVDLFSSLELEGQPCFHPVGSMEVAYTRERLEDLKRKLGFAKSWGVEAELISPEEAKSKIPLLDAGKILGAYHVRKDGIAKTVWACESMARQARAKGVRFGGQTKVTGIDVTDGRARGVRTDKGHVSADKVLLCAGIWGPLIGRMAGVPIPLAPVQHQYARTATVPDLAGETREVVHPILRHQDRSMYFRQQADCYGIGSYLHEPLLVEPSELVRSHAATMEFTPRHFEKALAAAHELLPPLRGIELVHKMNGVFSFTPDGMPILGESRDVRGLWVAEAVWITHAGGVGKVMAELMLDGVSSLDLRECGLSRFHDHVFSSQYVRERGAQQYREVYDIIHPLQQITHPRNLRLSPFYGRHVELGAFFFENAGWERPQWFDSNQKLLGEGEWPTRSGWEARYWSRVHGPEHNETRDSVAMYDLTPFVKVEVKGRGALTFLEHLCANEVDQPVGKVVYTSMLTRNAGVMCDLTVTRLDTDRFWVLTGAATGMHDFEWLKINMPNDGSVQITDVTSNYCCVGLWGPKAPELAKIVSEDDLSPQNFRSFTAQRVNIGNIPALALRVSYVGEMGWELYAPTSYGLALWDTLWSAGRPLGIIAAGGAAFDSLRLEKGYRLWGADVHTEYNPYEAGLGFAVKLDKQDFLGKDALVKVEDHGITRRLSRMYFDGQGTVVMGKEPIMSGDRVLGYVTSSNYGYTIGRGIAYGYLPIDYSKEGTKVDVYYFGKRYPATVVSERR